MRELGPTAQLMMRVSNWHWARPLAQPFTNRRLEHGVGMTYEEWFIYHVRLQQEQSS